MRREHGIVRIGNPRGKIAMYLDETEAIDLAYKYGHGDMAYDELLAAVEEAYPPPSEDEWRPGLKIMVSQR